MLFKSTINKAVVLLFFTVCGLPLQFFFSSSKFFQLFQCKKKTQEIWCFIFWIRFRKTTFLFFVCIFHIYCLYINFSSTTPPTTDSKMCKEFTKRETHSTWFRWRYISQYTLVRGEIPCFCWFGTLRIQKSSDWSFISLSVIEPCPASFRLLKKKIALSTCLPVE